MSQEETPLDIAITKDLMTKVADDVGAAIKRSAALAPNSDLPVVMAAAAAALGTLAAALDKRTGKSSRDAGPQMEGVMLAALLTARAGLNVGEGLDAAYKDMAALRAAGRIA